MSAVLDHCRIKPGLGLFHGRHRGCAEKIGTGAAHDSDRHCLDLRKEFPKGRNAASLNIFDAWKSRSQCRVVIDVRPPILNFENPLGKRQPFISGKRFKPDIAGFQAGGCRVPRLECALNAEIAPYAEQSARFQRGPDIIQEKSRQPVLEQSRHQHSDNAAA